MEKEPLFHQEKIIRVLAFVLGMTSVIGQIIILRELISVFYGNETSYAIILTSWLFWVAVGSSGVSRFLGRIRKTSWLIIVINWLTAIILPAGSTNPLMPVLADLIKDRLFSTALKTAMEKC